MKSILILISDDQLKGRLAKDLADLGYAVIPESPNPTGYDADAVIIQGTSSAQDTRRDSGPLQEYKQKERIGVLALFKREELPSLEPGEFYDDFLLIPYDVKELQVRLEMLLGRFPRVSGEIIRIEDVTIDVANYQVRQGKHLIDLTLKEFELLKFLATHRGQLFTRQRLLERVWAYDYYGGTRTVDVHIRRLRAKFRGPFLDLIETVRGVGYRFK
jgi:DNA-binding response OmpR family regulator